MKGMMRTMRFTIIVGATVCVLMLAAMSSFSVIGLSKLNTRVADVYLKGALPIANLGDMRKALLDIRLQLHRIQATTDASTVSSLTDAIREDEDLLHKAWNDYYASGVASGEGRAAADRIVALLPRIMDGDAKITSAYAAGDRETAEKYIVADEAVWKALTAAIDDGVDVTRSEAGKWADQGHATYRTTLILALTMSSMGLLIAIAISIYLLRSISRPLEKSIGVAGNISVGKLENDLIVDCGGEFGQLLAALKRMDEQLSLTVRRILASAASVGRSSHEIASGNMELSSRTEEQASSLEETAASMTQLTETVKQNADNAMQANDLATGAANIADTGNEAVQGMVGTIEKIASSSSKISDITGVIEGIAFQTNILALNAAVEAARAGEQGRGFAVVASEVRSLAQRSAAAAKDIKELIGASVAMIQEGARQASDVGATMTHVKQAIRSVSDIVAEIARASDEQNRGIEQVGQAISQMDGVTQQNAALVEQAAAAAQSLQEQANNLGDAVSVFVLRQSTEGQLGFEHRQVEEQLGVSHAY
ncbi:methyl-accepting chemotaxis protein [Burkholderia anthina]|uniref:methyl-accepting chemotaxis protein n=1 Tax=Burkholderia anthina TaxID=179879 RepID=UPI00158F2461|nr:methyl-accepting chemotaxis protein [Burkholderia anthina]